MKYFLSFIKKSITGLQTPLHLSTVHMWQKGQGKTEQNISIVGWNVNGLRSIIKKQKLEQIQSLHTDFICLNQTKIDLQAYSLSQNIINCIQNYYSYWNFCKISKGYSGVSIFSKYKPMSIIQDFPDQQSLSLQGRLLTLQFQQFYLVNIYKPNSGTHLQRLKYRTQTYDMKFNKYIQQLLKIKKVIIYGDMNVANDQIDLANPSKNKHKNGFTQSERSCFKQLLKLGMIDTFRFKHPQKQKYTYWSYLNKSRQNNVGWRIDYLLTSKDITIQQANIHNEILGSDHCPISCRIKLN